jgi:hypothetical protein
MSIQLLICGAGAVPTLLFEVLLVDFCCLVFFRSVIFSSSCAVVANAGFAPVALDEVPVFVEFNEPEHFPSASQQFKFSLFRSLSSASLACRRRIRIKILSLKSRRNRATS